MAAIARGDLLIYVCVFTYHMFVSVVALQSSVAIYKTTDACVTAC